MHFRNFARHGGTVEKYAGDAVMAAFGWTVIECDGHSVPELLEAFEAAKGGAALLDGKLVEAPLVRNDSR